MSKELEQRISELEKEVKHWKANHDRIAMVNAALRERPDLGMRTRSITKLAKRLEMYENCQSEGDYAARVHLESPDWEAVFDKECPTPLHWETTRRQLIARIESVIKGHVTMFKLAICNGNIRSRLKDELLFKIGVCPRCGEVITYDDDQPFAYCECGTSEWASERTLLWRINCAKSLEEVRTLVKEAAL